jgi:hypothetical protein
MSKFSGPIQRVYLVPPPGTYNDYEQSYLVVEGMKLAKKFHNFDEKTHPLTLKYFETFEKSPLKMNRIFSNVSFHNDPHPKWFRLNYSTIPPIDEEIPHKEMEEIIEECLKVKNN